MQGAQLGIVVGVRRRHIRRLCARKRKGTEKSCGNPVRCCAVHRFVPEEEDSSRDLVTDLMDLKTSLLPVVTPVFRCQSYNDGTTHVVFEPMDFMHRMCGMPRWRPGLYCFTFSV